MLPVTAGARLTLAFDVFCSPTPLQTESNADVAKTEMCQRLASLCRAPSNKAKTIAFGMRHEYPTDGGPIDSDALKGVDRLIYQSALVLGLKTKIQALIEDDGKGYHRMYPREDEAPG